MFKSEDLFEPISRRLRFVAQEEQIQINLRNSEDLTIDFLASAIVDLLNKLPKKSFNDRPCKLWLICVGTYPTKTEIRAFKFRIQAYGLYETFIWLFERILTTDSLNQNSHKIELIRVTEFNLVDITHTADYPHTTGIQRVVKKIAEEAVKRDDVVFLKWEIYPLRAVLLDSNNLFTPRQSVEITKKEKDLFLKVIEIIYWKIGVWFDSGSLRRSVKIILRKPARMLFHFFEDRINEGNEPLSQNIESHTIPNVYIFGHRITLLDVGLEHGPLLYPGIMDTSVEVQAVLYDFIPIFHAEFFFGAGEFVTLFSNYISYVLKSNKVIAISQLVREQAELIAKAMKLINPQSNQKITKFENINLPAGITTTDHKYVSINPQLFMMVGTLEPRKNHHQFLYALTVLNQLGISTKGVIIGINGFGNSEILDHIEECRSEGIDITLLNTVKDDELNYYYKSARALVMLSYAEGYGMPIIEASRLGTTVIAGKVRPFTDLPINDIHFIELGDVLGLAEVMLNLIHSPKFASTEEQNQESSEHLPTWAEWSNRLFC
jgi:glycosyltransferase involved in cell wall biosynthesis